MGELLPVPEDREQPAARVDHARLVGFTLALSLAAMAVLDGLGEQGVSWWTVAKAIGAAAVVLAYLYLVRIPRLRRGGR